MGKNYLIFSEQVGKQNPEWVAEEKGDISVQAIFPEHGKCLGIRKPGGVKEEEMSDSQDIKEERGPNTWASQAFPARESENSVG